MLELRPEVYWGVLDKYRRNEQQMEELERAEISTHSAQRQGGTGGYRKTRK